MASDLLSIAASGARAARGALDVTAQNIANASSEGYVRRSLRIAEVAASGGAGRIGDISLSGARIVEIKRNADAFAQAEMRRTQSDLARANTELGGLKNIESAIEQSGVYSSVVEFEAALQHLAGDSIDSSRRAQVLAEATTMANKFNITATSLVAASAGLQFEARSTADDINLVAGELARTNLRLSRAGKGSSDRAALLDQRDQLLARLSTHAPTATSFAADGAVSVTIGANPPRQLVVGGTAASLSATVLPSGTLQFDVDGQPTEAAGGTLGGAQAALVEIAAVRTRLDDLASGIAATVNGVQANGVALDGTAGQPIFSGTTAADFRVSMQDGAGIATAPASAGPGSRDLQNLADLRLALSASSPASGVSNLLFDVSSKVAGRSLTQSALETIASSARITFEQQSGVDLDAEAANLIRFQQAFQASGRAMQTASDIFDTLLGIGR